MTLGMLSFRAPASFIYTGGTPVPITMKSFTLSATVISPEFDPVPDSDSHAHRRRLRPSTDAVRAVCLRHRLQRGSRPAVRRSRQSLHDVGLCHLRLSGGARGPRLRVAAQHWHAHRRPGLRIGRHRGGGRRRHVAVRRQGVGGRHLPWHADLGVLANILNLTGVDPFVQQLFKGALIVAAVFIMSRTRDDERRYEPGSGAERCASSSGSLCQLAIACEDICRRLSDAPAPSTAAGAMRVPVLEPAAGGGRRFRHRAPSPRSGFGGVGSPVIFTGGGGNEKPFWAFAHLDTISSLVQPDQGGRVPLVPIACISCMTANAPRTLIAMILNRTAIAWSPGQD